MLKMSQPATLRLCFGLGCAGTPTGAGDVQTAALGSRTGSSFCYHVINRRANRASQTVRRRRVVPCLQANDPELQDLHPQNTTVEQKDPTAKQIARIAVLVSGGGRSVENLCQRIADGSLTQCQIALLIASKEKAGAIDRVKPFDIPTSVVSPKQFGADVDRFSEAISEQLDQVGIDLVVMAGWMHFYRIPSRYIGKVINIHPSLIPSFCGKGYYGSKVHQAVVAFGAKVSGCTVHLADNQYDHGPIILQKTVEVTDSDKASDLAARVFEVEKEALPAAVQLFVDGRITVDGNIARIKR